MTLRLFLPSAAVAPATVQTVLASLKTRNRGAMQHSVCTTAQAHVLDCGDGVRLQAWISAPPPSVRGSVVLLHGWEGCHESVYLLSAARALHDGGWQVARLNLRDHGFTHALNREMFHSARMDEVHGALKCIAGLMDDPAPNVVGFSMGGNFAIRVAAQAASHSLPVGKVIAVCPAIAPLDTLYALDACPAPIRRYFLRKWQRTLLAKQAAWPRDYDAAAFDGLRSFVDISRVFVERHTEFDTLDDYVAAYDLSVTPPDPSRPCTVITAKDDPVVRWRHFAGMATHSGYELIATERGGHCGFIENLRMRSWIDETLLALLD